MASLTDLLASRRARILERWTQRIRWEQAPEGLTHGELWDHLPQILEELLAAFAEREGRPVDAALPEQSPASARHGSQRLRVGFDVEQVVREYGILAEILVDEVEHAREALSHDEWRVALRSINTAIADAVAAYVRRRDEELRREAGRHVAFVAHELRRPVMAAAAAAAALRLAPADERLQAVLDRSLRRVGTLIDQVVIADRLASEVELRWEPLDAAALLREVIEDMEAAGESRKVRLSTAIEAPLAIAGDRRLLQSAFGNLVGNAVKFTRAGGTVQVRAARRGDALAVEVEDECGGLPPGDPEELFEPFVQRGEVRNGFGLGLAIVRQAVSAHGGHVAVRNEPGQGCTFVVTLPAAPPAPARS